MVTFPLSTAAPGAASLSWIVTLSPVPLLLSARAVTPAPMAPPMRAATIATGNHARSRPGVLRPELEPPGPGEAASPDGGYEKGTTIGVTGVAGPGSAAAGGAHEPAAAGAAHDSAAAGAAHDSGGDGGYEGSALGVGKAGGLEGISSPVTSAGDASEEVGAAPGLTASVGDVGASTGGVAAASGVPAAGSVPGCSVSSLMWILLRGRDAPAPPRDEAGPSRWLPQSSGRPDTCYGMAIAPWHRGGAPGELACPPHVTAHRH